MAFAGYRPAMISLGPVTRVRTLVLGFFAIAVAASVGAGVLLQGPATASAGTYDGHVTFDMPADWVAEGCATPEPGCVRVAPPGTPVHTGVFVVVVPRDASDLPVSPEMRHVDAPGIESLTVDGRQATRIERGGTVAADLLTVQLDEAGSMAMVRCGGDPEIVATGCDVVMDSLEITWP
ncbi:hypothetical protein Cci01nite_05390 [Catellatospora citrea]|uniref:Uncharacterized protein n=2 Tax=Catellatospora citrea TaxID=53366 RepID=A0A8J3KDY7_9ACTN|nr:hypothetical protein Cci01nite_05390 [Catellatospora citrea]